MAKVDKKQSDTEAACAFTPCTDFQISSSILEATNHCKEQSFIAQQRAQQASDNAEAMNVLSRVVSTGDTELLFKFVAKIRQAGFEEGQEVGAKPARDFVELAKFAATR